MSNYPKLKLVYFNAAGRAESIRLAFYIAGVPFEDERLTGPQFGALKSTFPFGQAPVLEIDGEMLAQSDAILRYAGRLGNLYPVNDAVAGLKIDEILGAMEEMQAKMGPSFYEQDADKKKALREELANVTFPRYLSLIEARLNKIKEYPVFQSTDVFIHEIVLFTFVRMMRNGVLDHIPTTIADSYASISAVATKIGEHPKVKEWYANPRNVAPKLKLTYFNGPGRAEPIRLAFHIGGVAFEDERVDRAELESRRASLPFGQLPVLDINGELLAQSIHILRYAGVKSGLYPVNDPMEALRIDEVFCLIDELYNAMAPTYRMEPEPQAAARKVLAEETIPKALGRMDSRAAKWGGAYAAGARLTVADLAIYSVVLGLQSGNLSGIPATVADPYANVMRIFEQVRTHPKVVEWYQAHK